MKFIAVSIFVTACNCFVSNRKYYDPATLPEITINDKPKTGYQYPFFPPFLLDEPPIFNVTDPIPDYPAYLPPTVTLRPPFFNPPPGDGGDDDTVVIQLPPSNEHLPPASDYLPAAQLKIFNMSCLDSPNRRYFRAVIRLPRTDLVPVMDDAPADCLTGAANVYRLDLAEERMKRCGVRYCSNGDQVNMCVGIRVPTLRGLRLLEDTSLTLQCKPQDRIVSHVKHMRFNAQSIQGRSAATIARGGFQPSFETQVELFRRSTDGTNKFSRPVNPGTVVQLGEDLLLKAAARDSDGWKYSRLGEVIVHHVSKSGRVDSRSAVLVDNAGCRDARMRSVCPDNPIQVSPLVTTLAVKAFMFQGMDNGDEMIMSVRTIGCLLQEDCYKGRSCEERTRSRVRRAATSNVTNWQSFLEFKVAFPEPNVSSAEAFHNPVFISVFAGLTLLLIMIFVAYWKLRK